MEDTILNKTLKREILHHIIAGFGGFGKASSAPNHILILDRKLSFEEDGKHEEKTVWSGRLRTEGSEVRFVFSDISGDSLEFVLCLQLDQFPPYALRASADEDDEGSFSILVEGKWIPGDTLLQARALVAAQSLFDSHIPWEKSTTSDDLFEVLVSFLKWESEDE